MMRARVVLLVCFMDIDFGAENNERVLWAAGVPKDFVGFWSLESETGQFFFACFLCPYSTNTVA